MTDDQTTGELIHGAIDDVKKLVRLEASLLKHEAIGFGLSSKRALGFVAIALAIVIPAITLLAFALASGLQIFSLFPQWLCFALVGLALAAVSVLCLAVAQRIVEKSIKELIDGKRSSYIGTGNREDYRVLARQD